MSANDQAARSEDARGVALQSLSLAPNVAELIKAAHKRDELMYQDLLPAGLVGIMLAPQEGSYTVRGIANGKDALIVGRAMNGKWRFFPVRIENSEALFVQATPNPIPQSPQLLFIRGANK